MIWHWCWTHQQATANPDGCLVGEGCRLTVASYPTQASAAHWESTERSRLRHRPGG